MHATSKRQLSWGTPERNVAFQMALERTEFIRKLKEAREQAGMSQEQLAREVGVTHKTANRWEAIVNGHQPKAQVVEQIAAALGVDRDYLLGPSPDTELRERRLLKLDEKVNEIHAMLLALLANSGITADKLVGAPASLIDALNEAQPKARKRRRSG